MRFRVRALGAGHRIEVLDMEAADQAAAMSSVAARGWAVLSVRGDRLGALGAWAFRPGGLRRPSFDLLLFAQELLALVGAGLGVVEALEALLQHARAESQRVTLQRLLAALREGRGLSQAMALQPGVFGPLFIGMVQAAEGTSDLPQALERFAAHETRRQALQHRLVSAAIYPTLLLVAGLVVGLFLLIHVVPQFAMAYPEGHHNLPWASQALLAWGRWAAAHGAWVLGLGGAGVLGLACWARAAWRTRGLHSLLMGMPRLRQRVHVLMLTRLYMTLGMLLDGGIPILRALQLCESAWAYGAQGALTEARAGVSQGESVSLALARAGLTTPVSLRLLQAGERSGQLGLMLRRCADFHDAETSRWVERLGRTVEPVLMALIGLVIGLVVVLLYLPIFELTSSL